MAARVALVPPLLGCVLLAALAVFHEGAFRAVVREDSVLEWAQVGAYAFAVIAATGVAQRMGGVVRVAYVFRHQVRVPAAADVCAGEVQRVA